MKISTQVNRRNYKHNYSVEELQFKNLKKVHNSQMIIIIIKFKSSKLISKFNTTNS